MVKEEVMNIAGHDIGVCSWSLRPVDMASLCAMVRQLGLQHMQLAVASLVAMDEPARKTELAVLRASGINLTSGMLNFAGEDYSSIAAIHDTGGYCPDRFWQERFDITVAAGRLAAEIGITSFTAHVGFIPPSSQPQYQVMLERIRQIAASLAENGVSLHMETGQEHAAELLQFLNDLAVKNVFVNFDPANMILYGAGDPIEAVRVLGRHIRHVHVKDAVMSQRPGIQWGEEVPFGTGQVKPEAFLSALAAAGYRGPLAIEREAGETRMEDVRFAIKTLQSIAC